MRYIIQCKYCGALLLKTKDSFLITLQIEIKCPNCKKILKLPNDVVINLDRKKRPGLEKSY